MKDGIEGGALYYTDPRTGVVMIVPQNTPSAMGEVTAFEPEGDLPDLQTGRDVLTDLVREGRLIIAYAPPLRVEASGPKNILPSGGNPVAVVCAAEGYQCENMTAVVQVADPGTIAILNDPAFPLAANIAAGGTPQANFGPNDTDPFTAVAAPAAIGLPANLLQQIEVVGCLIQGHEDLSHEIYFNMPVGQLIRLAATGSSVKVKAAIVPRYFAKLGGAASFQYIVAGTTLAADRQRNAIFNSFAPGQLAATFTAGTLPTTEVQVQGYVGRGFADPVPPQRVFFGAIDAAAAQNTLYRCPVAKGAQTVFLQCDASNANNDPAGGTAFQGCVVTMNFICGNNGRRNGVNIPANVTVPLPADCTAVEVVNVTNGALLVPIGVPFQLQYDVGF